MFTILGADGKEYGPVPADKVQAWINSRRASLQTKARREGETEWKTLGDFTEFASVPVVTQAAAPVAGTPPPAPGTGESGTGTAAAATTIPIAGDARTIADQFIARATPLDVFGCLGRSFELWKSNFFPLVGVTLLVYFVQLIVGVIPFLGTIARLLLNGVFAGGLYYYYLGKIRGEPREVGDAFAGFSQALAPLMLASLLTSVLIIAVMLPFLTPMFFFCVQLFLHRHVTALPQLSPLAVLFMLLGVIPVLYLSVSWAFAFPLVIDRRLGPWTAMEVSRRVVTHQWFRVFFVLLLGAILTMLGLIGLIIGVVFTLPLMLGALLCAYEDLCNPPPAPSAGPVIAPGPR